MRDVEVPNLETNPFFQNLMGRVDRIVELEGCCEGFVNWQGVLNIAQRLRGRDIFVDLFEAPRICRSFFDKIATMIVEAAHRLRDRQRGSGVDYRFATVSNCLVNMVSPEQYAEFLLPCDQRIAAAFDCIGVHNCAWTADPCLDHYASLPYLGYIDMGLDSDLARARELVLSARRAIMYTPMGLANKSEKQIHVDFARIARDYAPCDIVLADIEAGTPDGRIWFAINLCKELSGGEPVSRD